MAGKLVLLLLSEHCECIDEQRADGRLSCPRRESRREDSE